MMAVFKLISGDNHIDEESNPNVSLELAFCLSAEAVRWREEGDSNGVVQC